MKQFLAILMVLLLTMVTLTSCITISNGETTTEETTTAAGEETTEEVTTVEGETTAAQNGETTTGSGTTAAGTTRSSATTTKAPTTTKAVTTTKAPVITTPDTGAVWPSNRLTRLVPKPSGEFSVFSHDFNDSRGEAVVVLKDMSNQQALNYVSALKSAGFNNVNEEIKPLGNLVSFKASNSKGVTVEFWKAFDTYTLEIND